MRVIKERDVQAVNEILVPLRREIMKYNTELPFELYNQYIIAAVDMLNRASDAVSSFGESHGHIELQPSDLLTSHSGKISFPILSAHSTLKKTNVNTIVKKVEHSLEQYNTELKDTYKDSTSGIHRLSVQMQSLHNALTTDMNTNSVEFSQAWAGMSDEQKTQVTNTVIDSTITDINKGVDLGNETSDIIEDYTESTGKTTPSPPPTSTTREDPSKPSAAQEGYSEAYASYQDAVGEVAAATSEWSDAQKGVAIADDKVTQKNTEAQAAYDALSQAIRENANAKTASDSADHDYNVSVVRETEAKGNYEEQKQKTANLEDASKAFDSVWPGGPGPSGGSLTLDTGQSYTDPSTGVSYTNNGGGSWTVTAPNGVEYTIDVESGGNTFTANDQLTVRGEAQDDVKTAKERESQLGEAYEQAKENTKDAYDKKVEANKDYEETQKNVSDKTQDVTNAEKELGEAIKERDDAVQKEKDAKDKLDEANHKLDEETEKVKDAQEKLEREQEEKKEQQEKEKEDLQNWFNENYPNAGAEDTEEEADAAALAEAGAGLV